MKQSFDACLREPLRARQTRKPENGGRKGDALDGGAGDGDARDGGAGDKSEAFTRRALCEGCYDSVPDGLLARCGDRLLCPACAAIAEKANLPADKSSSKPRPAAGESPPGEAAPRASAGLHGWIASCCANRSWLPRAPLLIFLAYVLIRHLGDPGYQSIFKPLNLGIHELGHYVFMPLGKFLEIAGGSILQCLVPVVALGIFLKQRDLFAMAVSLGWLGTNLFDVATYAGDARAMGLPLVTPGGGAAIHDWNFLLGRLGMLGWDTTMAVSLRVAATFSMGVCLGAGVWLLWLMARTPRTTSSTE